MLSPLRVPLMALLALSLLVLGAACGAQQAAQQANQKILESTDMGLDNMTKARDMAVESQISSGIAADPGLVNVKDKVQVTTSHNVVVISGRVRTEEQKKRIEEIVKNAIATANVKDYELDLTIDPSIEDLPFDWS